MASIFDRHGTYYAQFFDAGRSPSRKRFSLRTTDEAEARAKLSELEEAAEFDPWSGDDPFDYETPERARMAVSDAIDLFAEQKEREGCTDRTVQTYRGTWRRFGKLVGPSTALSDLTASDVHEYVHEPSVSDATRRSRFRQLRAVLRWAGCEELLEDIDAPRRPKNLPTPIRRHELEKICDGLKRRYRRLRSERKTRPGVLLWALPVFRFAFFSGLRAGEIAALRWKDVDTERGVIRLRDTKSGEDQTAPLISPAERALDDAQRPRGPECYVWRTPEGPLRDRNEAEFARQLSRTFKTAREETDVSSEKSLHDLRAGFATALADAGMGAHQIRDAMRHANVETSMKYVRVSRRRLRSEMEAAFETSG